MLIVRKKCWAKSVKKWLLQNQPQEVAGFLPLAQSSLDTTLQLAATRAFQAGTTELSLGTIPRCRNPSFGLATKAKGLQGCGPRGSLGVTSETPRNVGECEGVSHHTPKATPTLGDGVPVDSQNFEDRFEGSKLNSLWRSLYHWKALGN